jgi:nucleoid DNA-binding protein
MTKREQVDVVAQAAGISRKQALAALDAVSAVIKVGLLEDERVFITGLGRFEVARRAPRRVTNPHTGLIMDLPATAVPKFKPAPELRRSVEDKFSCQM